MGTVFLFRHGSVDKPKERRYWGRTDLKLNHAGVMQFQAAANFLKTHAITKIYTSPLSRCRQSAAIIARQLQCPVALHDSMLEIHLGKWEGLSVAEVQKKFPGAYEKRGLDIAHYRPSGGESFADVQSRAWPFFLKCLQKEENSVIIAHAGVNRVLLCRFLDLPLDHLFQLKQDYGHCNILCRSSDGQNIAKYINYKV